MDTTILLALTAFTTSPPDTTRTLQALEVQEAPVIDGRLDEALWQSGACMIASANGGVNGAANGAVVGGANGAANGAVNGAAHASAAAARCASVARSFVQRAPQPGAPAMQRTEAMVAVDARALYVGIRMYDSAPDSIVGRLARRDDAVHSDWAYVHIGSLDDNRTGFVFGVNPRGVKRDVLISEDGRRDVTWDAVWEAGTHIDDHGWTAELRIPLAQLRYAEGSASWGLNIERHVARSAEVSMWAPTPPDAAGIVSHYGRLLGMTQLAAARRIELRPYVVSSVTRADVPAGDPFQSRHSLAHSIGGDMRYGIGGALTLTATINPDFGQVEGDPAQVNLTAFESFFPERRPFFTEGTEIFQAMGPPLFYSRRIGRAPQVGPPASATHAETANHTTILGAAKLTGRVRGGWTLGALGAVTDEERVRFVDEEGAVARAVVEPMTAYGVVRARREFDRGRSALGVLATGVQRRLGDDARLHSLTRSALAATVDGRWRIDDAHQVSGSLSGSHVAGPEAAIARIQRSATHRFHRPDAKHLTYDPGRIRLGGHAGNLNIARISGGAWRWNLATFVTGPGFEIGDAGFTQRSDRITNFASVSYESHSAGRHLMKWSVSPFLMNEQTYGGERQRTILDVTGEATLRNQATVYAWAQREIGGLDAEALRGGPALVMPSRWRGYASISSDGRRRYIVRGSGYLEREEVTGAAQANVNATLQLRPSNVLDASIGMQLQRATDATHLVTRVDGPPGDRFVVARLDSRSAAVTTRASYAVTPDLSLQLYARPFSYGARFSDFKEVEQPRATSFDERFHRFTADEMRYDADGDRYTAEREGRPSISFTNPDVGLVSLDATAVMRWEYRPGSTLFVVWGSNRAAHDQAGFPAIGRDVSALRRAAGSNTLLVKASYWLGR